MPNCEIPTFRLRLTLQSVVFQVFNATAVFTFSSKRQSLIGIVEMKPWSTVNQAYVYLTTAEVKCPELLFPFQILDFLDLSTHCFATFLEKLCFYFKSLLQIEILNTLVPGVGINPDSIVPVINPEAMDMLRSQGTEVWTITVTELPA